MIAEMLMDPHVLRRSTTGDPQVCSCESNVMGNPTETPGTDKHDQHVQPIQFDICTVLDALLAGYGKGFLHAGDKEWGVGKMQHDLTDAVQWAIDEARTGWLLHQCSKNPHGALTCHFSVPSGTYRSSMPSCTVVWPDVVGSVRVQAIADPAKVAIYGGSYGGA